SKTCVSTERMAHLRSGFAWPRRVIARTTSAMASMAKPPATVPQTMVGLVSSSRNLSRRKPVMAVPRLLGFVGQFDGNGQLADARLLAGIEHFGHALERSRAIA